jgi:hypothetical protein
MRVGTAGLFILTLNSLIKTSNVFFFFHNIYTAKYNILSLYKGYKDEY